METFVTLLIPALLLLLLIRILKTPVCWAVKLLCHILGGFLCLWLINSVSAYTELYIPINAVTIAVAGLLGIPGITFLTLLELIG